MEAERQVAGGGTRRRAWACVANPWLRGRGVRDENAPSRVNALAREAGAGRCSARAPCIAIQRSRGLTFIKKCGSGFRRRMPSNKSANRVLSPRLVERSSPSTSTSSGAVSIRERPLEVQTNLDGLRTGVSGSAVEELEPHESSDNSSDGGALAWFGSTMREVPGRYSETGTNEVQGPGGSQMCGLSELVQGCPIPRTARIRVTISAGEKAGALRGRRWRLH